MKKFTSAACVLLVSMLLTACRASSVEGFISDSMCGRKHIMPGASDAECTNECVKAGAQYVVVADDKIYFLAGNLQDAAALAGKKAHVEGAVSGNTITVSSMR